VSALTARIADGIRVWFTVQTVQGALYTGLGADDFVVTVIAAGDDASTMSAVSESSEKPGAYYYDIPSAFLATNGAGDYMSVIELDASGPPTLSDVKSNMINVSQADIDSLNAELAVVRGQFDRYVIDGGPGQTAIIKDAAGMLLTGRVRIFATAADAAAATLGAADDDDGEIARSDLTAVAAVPGALDSMRQVGA